MSDIEVIEVERNGGVAQKVRLRSGEYEIVFVLIGGAVKKISACRYGVSIADRIYVPPAIYNDALKRAYAILKPKTRKRGISRSLNKGA